VVTKKVRFGLNTERADAWRRGFMFGRG